MNDERRIAEQAEHQCDINTERYMDGMDVDINIEEAHAMLDELALLVGKYKDIDLSTLSTRLEAEGELVLEHAKALNIAINNDDNEEAGKHLLALCKIHLG